MQTTKHFKNTSLANRLGKLALAFALVLGLPACATMETDAGYYQRLNAVQALHYGLQQNGWDKTAANPNRLPMSQPQTVQQAQPCSNPYACPMQYYGR